MSQERYIAIFRLEDTVERNTVLDWLKQNLKEPNTISANDVCIMVQSLTKDDAHKCAVWISNRNPVRKLKYIIRGFRGKKMVYLSQSKSSHVYLGGVQNG